MNKRTTSSRRRTAVGFAAILMGMLLSMVGLAADPAAAFEGSCTPDPGDPSSGVCVLDETSGNDPSTWGTMTYSRVGDVVTFDFVTVLAGQSIVACFNVTAAYSTVGQSCTGNDSPQYNGNFVDPLAVNLAAPPTGNAIVGFDPGDPVFFSIHVTQGGRTTYGIGSAGATPPPPPPPPPPGPGPVVPGPVVGPVVVTPPAPPVAEPEVQPEVIVPETPAVPETPVAPPTQVLGEVVTRAPELPRTGATTLPLLEVGLGLVLLGAGVLLFGRERTSLI